MKSRLYLVILVLLFIISLTLTGCGSRNSSGVGNQTTTGQAQQTMGPDYQDITPETLKKMMSTDKDLMIVDVREKAEYNDGHIPGAQLYPLSEFQARATELPKDKKIVLVCLSGSRSSQAAAYLVKLGYSQVYNLDGGIAVWPYEITKQ